MFPYEYQVLKLQILPPESEVCETVENFHLHNG